MAARRFGVGSDQGEGSAVFQKTGELRSTLPVMEVELWPACQLLTWHFFYRNPPHLLLLALALALTLPPAAPQPAPGSAAEPQEDDARCLKGVKADLRDPEGRLTSWTSNTSAGAVCDFSGISCWNPQESRILAVSLSGFGLQGKIPPALQYCRSANMLDLSSNALEGQIPPALCDWIPFVVNLDLSGNRLTGPLPSELANCRFLNSLKLSDNAFSGQIPASLARLDRLKALDLSGNRLEGQIPSQLGSAFSKDSFSGNSGLCGHPVSSRCGSGLGGTGLGIVMLPGSSAPPLRCSSPSSSGDAPGRARLAAAARAAEEASRRSLRLIQIGRRRA
ncbi:inactive LRR receptor-like serine/threonine-protein kinase BIR2 [Aegilops tauschii subsp. strangulata]|uniref:inactive LRR receptor-like serine/threonine-protein kinase BIR2 n=1 Tax=Aegilops tauschii subsp. strangulata TaxID=200361 RepID=UPI000989E520